MHTSIIMQDVQMLQCIASGRSWYIYPGMYLRFPETTKPATEEVKTTAGPPFSATGTHEPAGRLGGVSLPLLT